MNVIHWVFEMATKKRCIKKKAKNWISPPAILVAHSRLTSNTTKIVGGPTRFFKILFCLKKLIDLVEFQLFKIIINFFFFLFFFTSNEKLGIYGVLN